MLGKYDCRFCGREMVQSENQKTLEHDGFHLAYILFWECKHCGIYLIESRMNYDKEQMKEINKMYE